MKFCKRILRHCENPSKEGLFRDLVRTMPGDLMPYAWTHHYHPGEFGSLANNLYYVPATEEWLFV